MENNRVCFGIIGCGTISKWHAQAINLIDDAKLAGATDVNESSRNSFSKEYGIMAYSSTEELLGDKKIDAVCICTPSGLHSKLAIQAANAGKHVVIEKPMAITVEQCDEIIEACEKNNVKMAVISQLRFTEAISSLKSALETGRLGMPVMGDIYMKYYRSQEYYDRGGWRGTWEMDGGGALMNQGIHGVDLLQYVMGPVKSVYAKAKTMARKIDVEDTVSALIEFENGAVGVIQAATSVYPGLSRRLEINGTKGSVTVIEDTVEGWDVMGEEESLVSDGGKSDISAASNPEAFGIEGHVRQIGDMVDAINTGRRPMVDQYEGRKAVEIIRAIYQSSEEKKEVVLGG